MKRTFATGLLFLATSLSAAALDPKYQIRYGDPGKTEVVEYFSLSCKKCHEWFAKDFPEVKREYIDEGSVSWVFHPLPADRATLQFMVCLDKLPEEARKPFFEAVSECMASGGEKEGCLLMQSAMQTLGVPVPELDDMDILSESPAFQDALDYLQQKDVVLAVPTLEIDGVVYDRAPTREFLEEQIKLRMP